MKAWRVSAIKNLGLKARGFTMIELVSIIVIMGVLAAAALPRFANLSSNAKISTFAYTAAVFSTSVQLFHTAWLSNGARGYQQNVPWFGNGTLESSGLGYPAGIDSGSYTQTSQDCADVFNGIFDGAYTISVGPRGTYGNNADLTNLSDSYSTDYVAAATFSVPEHVCRYACLACEYTSGSSKVIPIFIYHYLTGVVEKVSQSY